MAKITVENTEISVISFENRDYICLTDMANAKENESRAADIIKNWLRNRYTIEFLGTWEMIHNPDFKVVEFDHFKMQAGLPTFTLSCSEWIEKPNAIGIIVKKGKYGGTYAHKDIAFEFGTAISVPFKLYLIEEFQRLKEDEQKQLGWSAKRELAKINYRIHTDAIKQNLIPPELTPQQKSFVYADEADMLNVSRSLRSLTSFLPDFHKSGTENSHVRADRPRVARSTSRPKRKYPRLRDNKSADLPFQYGKFERRVH